MINSSVRIVVYKNVMLKTLFKEQKNNLKNSAFFFKEKMRFKSWERLRIELMFGVNVSHDLSCTLYYRQFLEPFTGRASSP